MRIERPILIIDDDPDDQYIFSIVLEKLAYEFDTLYFNDARRAFDYLTNDAVKPFLIISDINMPGINGLELQHMIQRHPGLTLKSIPFIFLTTSASKHLITEAYAKGGTIQGVFQKPATIEEFEIKMRKIIEYWRECVTPNDFE